MEFETPAWLTKHFLQKTIQYGNEYDVIIEDLKITKPVPKGNNYVTDIFGVEVKYRSSNELKNLHNKSLIIKVPIKGPVYEIHIQSGLLAKEPAIYNEYVPKLKSVLGQIDDDGENENNEKLLAKSYFCSEENVMILEDLKPNGYKMVERIEQLDYEHCIVAIISLAKLHAGSVVLHEKDPEFVEKIGKEVLYCEPFTEVYNIYLKSCFDIIASNLKSYPELEKYSNWFEEHHDKMWDLILNDTTLLIDEFNVLNHGDFWLTNMLFKYDTNVKPSECIPIDFQCCRYGSPVLDFLFLIDTSAQEIVRNNQYDDLIEVYIKELNSNLEKYGSSKKLTELEFKKSISARKYFRIFITAIILPMVIVDTNEAQFIDLSDISIDDCKNTEVNPFKTYVKNRTFLERLSKRMDEFDHSSRQNGK